ncbi:MAG: HlyD family secretion protein, partial [Verrucomicrobiaceae bacterium]|nr:HlyD family secretion protein [Verrucomicrobiaceae bacterium]
MNAQLAARGALDTESEMLPQDPPAWIVRVSAWLITVFFVIALLAACLVELPETVNCPFVLMPRDGADPIQSPYLAMIHKVAANEGDAVKQGAELFVLRSDEVRNLDMQFRNFTEDLSEREASLQKADGAFQAQVEIKDAEIAQSESEVGFRERHVKTSRELVERMERLSKSGGISQIELLRLRLDLAEAEKDLSVAQRTLQQVNLERQRMEMDRARQRGQDVSEIEKIKYRLSGLKRDLENADQNLITLRAPYDAVVISVSQRTPGSIVQNGQELCQLARLE